MHFYVMSRSVIAPEFRLAYDRLTAAEKKIQNMHSRTHAVVNIELNIVTCPTYPDKFIRDNVVHWRTQRGVSGVQPP